MKKIAWLLLLIVTVGCLVVIFRGAPENVSPPALHTVPPVDCRMSLLSGTESQPSLITLRFFSGILRQTELKKRNPEEKERRKVQPVVVKISPEIWKEKVTFFRVDPKNGAKEDISEAVLFRKGIKGDKLIFAPHTVYTVHYGLSPSDKLSATDVIVAHVQLADYKILSNSVVLHGAPQSDREALYREALIAHRLRNYDELLALAGEMVKQQPKNGDAYFFKGVALEGKSRNVEALAAYQQSLTLITKAEKGELREPPMLLFSHIQRVKEKLGRITP